jgi:ubiquinone/menaquinone biosynthesis C-methylase UbiE
MKEFDAKTTAAFFNKTYRGTDIERGEREGARLHHRDRILLDKILPPLGKSLKILDYGCGLGRLCTALVSAGYDAWGMEKHDDMRAIAEDSVSKVANGEKRMLPGSVDELAAMPAASYDMFIAMGVFQYLSKAEYDRTLAEIHRVLKPGGTLIATWQNAMFDAFTFNKYTIDFMMDKLVGPQVEKPQTATVQKDLESLLVSFDKPPYAATRARDNIFVYLTNPLTIEGHLQTAKFTTKQKFFYEWFGLPPLIISKHPETAKKIAEGFEVENAKSWQGHFMANAFLIEARKI